MNNDELKIQYYSKSELAKMAHVSYSTFYRFLVTRREQLSAMGVSIHAKKLPYNAVRLICHDYDIDL